ncbi:hypothetical protein BASA81_007756 [Batrachochytrium salamandrivorans]|nr:hypothetical protein BASA81_007756 [Batrachochytrium salamandrivorans]
MSESNQACNIDRKGRKQRVKVSKLVLALALAFATFLAQREKSGNPLEGMQRYAAWALAQTLFVSAAVIYQQVLDQVCVAHAVAGTKEEGPESMKPVKVDDEKEKKELAKKGLAVVAKGTAKGLILSLALVFGPVLLFQK